MPLAVKSKVPLGISRECRGEKAGGKAKKRAGKNSLLSTTQSAREAMIYAFWDESDSEIVAVPRLSASYCLSGAGNTLYGTFLSGLNSSLNKTNESAGCCVVDI